MLYSAHILPHVKRRDQNERIALTLLAKIGLNKRGG